MGVWFKTGMIGSVALSVFTGWSGLHATTYTPVLITQQPTVAASPQVDSTLSPQVDANTLGVYTPMPISNACPFPTLQLSKAASELLFPELTPQTAQMQPESIFGLGYKPGDGSEAERYLTRFVKLVKAKQLGDALKMAQGFQDLSIKNKALLEVAAAYRESPNIEQAFVIAKQVKPSTNSKNAALNQRIKDDRDYELLKLVEAYLQASDPPKALAAAEQISIESRYGALFKIANAYQETQQFDQATKLLNQALSNYRTSKTLEPTSTQPIFATLSGFAIQYAATGQMAQAVTVASEAINLAKTLPQYSLLSLLLLSQTIQIYETAKPKSSTVSATLTSVLQRAQTSNKPLHKAVILAKVGEIYTLIGQPQRSKPLLSQAVTLTQSKQDITEKNLVLIEIARAYSVMSQHEQAAQTTQALQPPALQTLVRKTLDCSQQQDSKGTLFDLLRGR
jgi:tetratricopeptide (TPR) repeat protein